jgi:D-beta-D-heptose 7-phosphate kinase/D-beta-D-heptose 1-phosphate adenosyltransferase
MNQHLVSIDHAKLRAGLKQFNKANVLVIGDIIVDHFIYGSVTRISPEAPVPVVNVNKETLLLGGSANVLHNLYGLGARGTICGIIGTDFMGEQFLSLLDEIDSPTTGVIRSDDRPTTKKTRVIAQNQQIVRFDREQAIPLTKESLMAMYDFLDEHLNEYQAVVVSDYNKGVICAPLMDHLRPLLKKHNIPMIVDPKPGHPELFKGATIITPNNLETKLMSGIDITDSKSLLTAANKLKTEVESEAVLITRGEEGMALLSEDEPLFCIPTVAREVYDVTGAGDTVIATLAMGLAVGLSHKEAATLANYAAGIVVGKVGTATTSQEELLEVLQ